MADPREIFPILDDGSDVGVVPRAVVDGVTSPAGEYGMIGFSFKNSAGNVVLPQLNPEGAIPVTLDAGTTLRANGELAAGSASLVDVTGALITATLNKAYSKLNMFVSCRRDALFQLVHVDDSGGSPTETVLVEAVLGAGQYSVPAKVEPDYFDTTGGTGVQEFKVKGMNFNALSSLRAALSVNEIA